MGRASRNLGPLKSQPASISYPVAFGWRIGLRFEKIRQFSAVNLEVGYKSLER